jgi:hypothetical protein
VTSPNDHCACEARYRALLDRLEDLSERVERLEHDQRTVFDLLRDFRELTRLVVVRLRATDHRLEEIAARLIPFRTRDERVARHFRN